MFTTPIRKAVAGASALIALMTLPAQAEIVLFQVTWSGVDYGNSASATAVIGFDDTVIDFSQPFSIGQPDTLPLGLESLSLTVSGAGLVNGTYDLSYFTGMIFDSGGTVFDLSQDLVGQNNWGSTDLEGGMGGFGDFNLFSSGALNGTGPFVLGVNDGGMGYDMAVTSFTAVPEPSHIAGLAGLGALAVAVVIRRKRAVAK